MQSEFIWPLSRSIIPDLMNTSFGPRINENKRQFHEGIDLPAPLGTYVYAMHSGIIKYAREGNSNFKSRHVVIEVNDTKYCITLFLIYLHLSKINENIKEGSKVRMGDYIGNVGMDLATSPHLLTTYPHLHIQFREKTLVRCSSVHPLKYLPYTDTVNFNGELIPKYQKSGPSSIKARLFFRAISKNEGDLMGAEVLLFKNGSIIDGPRIIEFENSKTIEKCGENSDEQIFNDQGIGVEGYQKSDMVSDMYNDLHYGILLRNIPNDCDKMSAKVFDVGGNVTVCLILILYKRLPLSSH